MIKIVRNYLVWRSRVDGQAVEAVTWHWLESEMRLAAVTLIVLTLPAFARDLDLSGRWEGTITTVGTRMSATYSPVTGVTLSPVPDLKIMPSPFGPLDLRADGTWVMPVLALDGEWSLNGTALEFTGGLKNARVEQLEARPALVIDFDIGQGGVQTVTFSRAP